MRRVAGGRDGATDRWWRCGLLVLLVLGASVSGCDDAPPPLEDGTSDRFAVGQVWTYRTRDGEEGSLLTVGKLTELPGLGTVVHVSISGVRIPNAQAPGGVSTVISHVPLTEDALASSVLELTDGVVDLDGFEEGYGTWLEAYRTEGAGAFTVPIAKLVEYMEQALREGEG